MEAQSRGSDNNPFANSSPRNAASSDGEPRRGISRGLDVLRDFLAGNLTRSPLSLALEYSGLMLAPPQARSAGSAAVNAAAAAVISTSPRRSPDSQSPSAEPCAAGASGGGDDSGEVSIRIIGGGGHDDCADGSEGSAASVDDHQPGSAREREPLVPPSPTAARPENFGSGSGGGEMEDPGYQSYDIQQIAQWIEQILPFSILLLVVFIRQHLIGTFFFFFLLSFRLKLCLLLLQCFARHSILNCSRVH